jgi:hypothetical protein
MQAAIVGPSGTLPFGDGAFGPLTNALSLTIGY